MGRAAVPSPKNIKLFDKETLASPQKLAADLERFTNP